MKLPPDSPAWQWIGLAAFLASTALLLALVVLLAYGTRSIWSA